MVRSTSEDPSEQAPKAPTTAGPQALGYSLQYTRLTAMLLEASAGTACSLEVLDDVAASPSDGRTVLVQSKSALGDNPVSDRAPSLWKSLKNWLQLIEKGFVNPDQTTFELYVSRKVGGAIVDSFHNAKTEEQARTALEAARRELWGKEPLFPLRKSVAQNLAEHLDAVFSAPEKWVLPMIVNMRLHCGSGSPQEDLLQLLSKHPISKVTKVADQLQGWVKRQVDVRLEQSLPAVIKQADFHREYLAYVRSADRDTILDSFAPTPTEEEKVAEMSDVFVRQLELIEADYDEKLEAVSDYLRACWDRTYWSTEGDVHENSFELLDDNLCRKWKNIRLEKLLAYASSIQTDQGRIIYASCMQHNQIPVQAMVPPPHFIPGCFHRLADALKVGWHPDYENKLKKIMVAESA